MGSETVEKSQDALGTDTELCESAPPALQKWKAAIEEAARQTGLPAEYIAATMWAESRGNPDESSLNPDGQNTDVGLMQISEATFSEVNANQGGRAGNLNVNDPFQNILAGAWELKDKFEKSGGNFAATSAAYVGTGNDQYVADVMEFWKALDSGQALRD